MAPIEHGNVNQRSLDAVAKAIEDQAGRLSIARDARTLEEIVDALLTIAGNARSGVLDG